MAKKKSNASHAKNNCRHGSSNTSIEVQGSKLSIAGAGIAVLLLIAIAFFFGQSSIQNHQSSSSKDAFLKWFIENGGTFHPIGLGNGRASVNVTIEEFPSYGGWGLALPIPPESSRPSDECQSENANGECIADYHESPIIRHLDPLFTVPSSIIISVESILDTYAATTSPLYLPEFYPTVNKILVEAFPNNGPGLAKRGMGLAEQDVVIAMYLMVEDCQHKHHDEDSHFGPYLDILPQYIIPRLDTFGDEEYAALQDKNLEDTGRKSRSLLEKMYYNDDSSNSRLQSMVQDMIRQKIGPSPMPSVVTIPSSCLSFEAFHQFVGIVSSRACLLKGVKHLTPLAEMINYAPHEEKHDWIRAPFDLYHTLSDDNSITVRSDRDIFLAETSGVAGDIQLFEDYGPVDSSLFLEAHGFVPHENPNNCATISGSFFLRRNTATGRYDENAELVLRAMKAMHLIHPMVKQFYSLEDVCVKGNLEIVDDGNTIGRKPASDSIALASLLLGDSNNSVWNRIEREDGETFASLREKCASAILSGDTEWMEIRCARYPGSKSIVKQALRTAAGRALRSFEDKGDTEEKLLLRLKQAELQAELDGRHQLILALRFRVEERKMLALVAQSQHVKSDDNKMESSLIDDLDKKLMSFNAFIESLALPLNKIEPKLVGNRMRIGAFAREDLELDDAYISLPVNSVIDVTTALANVDESSAFAALLRKYSNLNGSQQNDGFDVLLLYLLHERFVLEEQSRWWPYLDLLPSIEELGTFHPLFFQEEEIDRYLAGSDVRRFMLMYQRRAAERHTSLSSDLDANLVLGSEILLDKNKVLWATAVLDSRSIWWGGKRHLSPLLDLANAGGIGRAHETRLEDPEDTKQYVAVTRASRRIQKGEQVFKNYAQPNYLLFTYHGFLLEGNANDCALLDGLFINRDDPGAKNAHRTQSVGPTFCIRDLPSIESLAQFLRVKYDLSSGSNIDDRVRPYLIQVLEARIARLMEATNTKIDAEGLSLPRLQFMRQIVKNDLMHFQHALNTHVLIQNTTKKDE